MANKKRKKRQVAGLKKKVDRLTHRSAPAGFPDMEECRRDLTCRSYQVRADTFDKATRSIEAVIATEEQVLVYDMERWEIIEEILLMDGCVIPDNRQIMYIDTHMRFTIEKQLGSTRELRIEGDKLVGRNFCAETEEGDRALALLEGGHLTDNSIGYRVENSVTIDPGKTANVNGREFTASPTRTLRVTTEWTVRENSACPIGADGAAKNRSDEIRNSKTKTGKEPTMEFKLWLQKRGLDYDQLSETQRAALKEDFASEQKRASETHTQPPAAVAPAAAAPAKTEDTRTAGNTDNAADLDAVRKEAVAAERKRCDEIRAAANGLDIGDDVVNRCIDENIPVEQARAAILESLQAKRIAKVGDAPAVIIGSTNVNRELIVDAMMLRAGNADIILAEANGEQRANQADNLRDIALLDICRYAIQLDGLQLPVGREEMLRAAVSTLSLPTILGAVYNKSLLKGYQSVEQTWRKWCNTGSMPDFKTATRVRLTADGGFEEVGPGGDLSKGSMAEEKEQYALTTQGKLDKLTRQDIINDDLGVLTRHPQRMGAQGARRIGEIVYAHFMGNPTMGDDVVLFISAHKNLNTGKALTEANLQNAITKFRKQTDKAGKPIKVAPKYLVVPPELEFTARKLLESVEIFIKGSTDGTAGSKNVLNGLLELVVEESLSNSSYTNYSTTTWYVTADPNIADTVEVGFLNGRQEPTVNTFANIPGFLGVQFDAYLDVAAKALDHRTVQKNTA